MEVENDANAWEGYVDYRFRRAQRGRHGGMRAALFVLVVEVLENLAFLANASNLVLYLRKYMNLSPSRSAINGLVILTFQARSPYLKPAPCDKPNTALCEHVHGGKAAMLFIGLYLVAFGVG
nr:protein NRT1/ PTR FAMILY 4.6 [Tanacetum cinerariifolium]